jgi:hypothetical protein
MKKVWLKKLSHYTLVGLDLTIRSTAGTDDTGRPRRQFVVKKIM